MDDVSAEHLTCVIVVNYGSSHLIADNLSDLSDGQWCHVIVVDNFTTSAEQHRVLEMCRERPGWHAVALDSNTGFGGGVNAGLEVARNQGADAFILINPDARIDRQTVRGLAEHTRDFAMELVTPRIVRPDNTVWCDGFALDLRNGQIRSRPGLTGIGPHEVPWVTGACMGFSRRLLDVIGGVPGGYFLYWEDVDLCMRVREGGGSLRVRSDLVVVHDEGGTQREHGPKTRRMSNRYYFYNCRNRLVFASRHLGRRRMLSWLCSTPRQSWLILLRGGRRQLLSSQIPLLAAVAGSLCGVPAICSALVKPFRGTVLDSSDVDAGRSSQEDRSQLDEAGRPYSSLMDPMTARPTPTAQ